MVAVLKKRESIPGGQVSLQTETRGQIVGRGVALAKRDVEEPVRRQVILAGAAKLRLLRQVVS